MATKAQIEAASLYGGIMEEIKIRIQAIDMGTGGFLPNLHPAVIREHCYLQLRMVCELIAIGCLVAHGDIEGPKMKRLRKEWAADKIMDELSSLHPEFYPRTVRQIPEPPRGMRLEAISPHPLPREELIKLYGRSGDVLHRGTAKNLIKRGTIQINYPDITALAQKIVDLLGVHTVHMKGGKMLFICVAVRLLLLRCNSQYRQSYLALPPNYLAPLKTHRAFRITHSHPRMLFLSLTQNTSSLSGDVESYSGLSR